jgi:hypothetical protein
MPHRMQALSGGANSEAPGFKPAEPPADNSAEDFTAAWDQRGPRGRASRAPQRAELARRGGRPARHRPGLLAAEVPAALAESLEGLDRVTRIVRAMKDFSHPGQGRAQTDLTFTIGLPVGGEG